MAFHVLQTTGTWYLFSVASRSVLRDSLRSSCKPVSLTIRAAPPSGGCGSTSCSDAFGESNLVDPASSHMLVSKIKPCMSKYKFFTAKL